MFIKNILYSYESLYFVACRKLEYSIVMRCIALSRLVVEATNEPLVNFTYLNLTKITVK